MKRLVTVSSTYVKTLLTLLFRTIFSAITTKLLVSVSYSPLAIAQLLLKRLSGWTENVTAEGTIHHNWFDTTNQRNPSADNLLHAHLYNNYLTGITSYGHYARGSTNARIENVYFADSSNPITADDGAILTSTGTLVDDGSDDPVADQGVAFVASDFYDYTLDATEDVPSIVEGNAGPQASVCS